MSNEDPAAVQRRVATEAAGLKSPPSSTGETTGAPDPDWPADRLPLADFLAVLVVPVDVISPEERRRALGDLVAMGVVREWSIDDRTGAATLELSDAYRRLVEAGRDPHLEPGFDAAWNAGGYAAIQEWLNAEADAL